MSESGTGPARLLLQLTETQDGVDVALSFADANGVPHLIRERGISWDTQRLRDLTKVFQVRSSSVHPSIGATECGELAEMLGEALLPGRVRGAFVGLCDGAGEIPVETRLRLEGGLVRAVPWELAAIDDKPVFDGRIQVVREVDTERRPVDPHGDGTFRVIGVTGRPDVPGTRPFPDPHLDRMLRDLGLADVQPVTTPRSASLADIDEAIILCHGYADVLVYWGHGDPLGLWLADDPVRPVAAKWMLDVLTGSDVQPRVGIVVLVACWTAASGPSIQGLAESLASAGIATVGVQAEFHTELARYATESVVRALRMADDVGLAIAAARAELQRVERDHPGAPWAVGAGGLLATWAPEGRSMRLSKMDQGVPATPKRRVKEGHLELDRFVGRREMIEQVTSFAHGGFDQRVLVIKGRRGEGKSTLLRYLEQHQVGSRPILDVCLLRDPALVRDDLDTYGAEEVLDRISKAVYRKRGWSNLATHWKERETLPLGSRLRQLVFDPLNEWFADHQDDHFVIALDEVDKIEEDELNFVRDQVFKKAPSQVRFVCTSSVDISPERLGMSYQEGEMLTVTLPDSNEDVAKLARIILEQVAYDDDQLERDVESIVKSADGLMKKAWELSKDLAEIRGRDTSRLGGASGLRSRSVPIFSSMSAPNADVREYDNNTIDGDTVRWNSKTARRPSPVHHTNARWGTQAGQYFEPSVSGFRQRWDLSHRSEYPELPWTDGSWLRRPGTSWNVMLSPNGYAWARRTRRDLEVAPVNGDRPWVVTTIDAAAVPIAMSPVTRRSVFLLLAGDVTTEWAVLLESDIALPGADIQSCAQHGAWISGRFVWVDAEGNLHGRGDLPATEQVTHICSSQVGGVEMAAWIDASGMVWAHRQRNGEYEVQHLPLPAQVTEVDELAVAPTVNGPDHLWIRVGINWWGCTWGSKGRNDT